MTTSITPMNVTAAYQSLTILTYNQLHKELIDIEAYVNTDVILNIVQVALDVFGDTYSLNSDGLQTRTNPIITDYALLSGAMVVTGNWTFSGNTNFSGKVNSTSTFSSTGQQKCKSYISAANQSIGNAALTALSFDSETYDTGAMHDTGINPNRITIPAAGDGIYILNTQVTFAASATGLRTISFYKNGSKIAEAKCFNPHATEQTVLNLFVQDQAVTTDYYEVQVYQDSTGALDVVKGENITYVSTIKVW